MKKLFLICAVLFLPLTICAQGFSSGSTGADGPLDLSTCSSPCTIPLPDSGVLNYTTVNIPTGKYVIFKRNSRNTPVYILAQGDVNIASFIDVSAGLGSSGCHTSNCEGKVPGPGGFYGGDAGQAGFGPGGGQPSGTTGHGQWVGPLSLVPIVGGSGGAGDGDGGSGLGGGGGGAIVIASSTSIVITPNGFIAANGQRVNFGSLGSGGAIRLVANSLTVGANLMATSVVGSRPGVVRLEGGTINFTGTSTPAAVLSTINPAIVSSTQPTLRIVSIGGSAVPTYAGSRFDTVDLLLANQLQDPIAVQVSATNIPVGTQISIGFFGSPSATTTPGNLAGTFQNSTATATISGLNRAVPTYLLATAVFDPPANASMFNPAGPNHVAKVRVEAKIGAKPSLVFLRKNGTVVESAKLQKSFLALLGQ